MRFKVQSRDIQKKLEILSKVSKTKSTLPILQYFKVVAEDNVVFFTASDMDVTLKARVVPEEVITTGSVCILADKLTEVVKSFKECTLDFSFDGNKNLTIKSGSGKFRIPCVDAEDFPITHEPSQENVISIPSEYLINGINKTIFATGKDEYRPALNGILLDFKVDKTVIIATNLVVMGVSREEPLVGYGTSVIMSTKLASVLLGVIGESDASTDMSFDEKNIKIELADYTLYGRKIEAEYPNYGLLIGNDTDTCVRCNRENLIDVVKRSILLSSSRSSAIQLSVLIGLLQVSGEDVDWGLSAEEDVYCENVSGSDIVLVNGRYTIEILQRIATDEVELSFGKTNPIVYINPVGTTDDYFFGLAKLAQLTSN